MRVIFSQRFNTSQLASVQGGSPPPPSRPRRQAQPVAYAAAASASLFVYLVVSAQLLLTAPQKYNPGKRKPKKSENLVKGPRAKLKKVQTWEAQQSLQTPTPSPSPVTGGSSAGEEADQVGGQVSLQLPQTEPKPGFAANLGDEAQDGSPCLPPSHPSFQSSGLEKIT